MNGRTHKRINEQDENTTPPPASSQDENASSQDENTTPPPASRQASLRRKNTITWFEQEVNVIWQKAPHGGAFPG